MDNKQVWYFTFGVGHKYPNCYAKFYGTFEEAREKMIETYGEKWAFQYASAKAAGVEEYNLFCVN